MLWSAALELVSIFEHILVSARLPDIRLADNTPEEGNPNRTLSSYWILRNRILDWFLRFLLLLVRTVATVKVQDLFVLLQSLHVAESLCVDTGTPLSEVIHYSTGTPPVFKTCTDHWPSATFR